MRAVARFNQDADTRGRRGLRIDDTNFEVGQLRGGQRGIEDGLRLSQGLIQRMDRTVAQCRRHFRLIFDFDFDHRGALRPAVRRREFAGRFVKD